MNLKGKALVLALVGLAAWFQPRVLRSATAREAYEQSLADLQSSPDDMDLRRHAIELGLKLKALPAVPDEVRVLEGKAVFTAKSATAPEDYKPAADMYMKASLLAPCDAILYFNAGVLLEKAEEPGKAISALKLYLLARPDADDKDKVLDRIGKLEVLRDKKRQADQDADAAAREKARKDAEYAAALQAWQKRDTPSQVLLVTGGIATGLGLAWLIYDYVSLGVDVPSGGSYTTPEVYQGTPYTTEYQGNYYTAAAYKSFEGSQSQLQQQLPMAWGVTGVGVVLCVIGVTINPGPKPVEDASLLNYRDGRFAFGLPVPDLTPRAGLLRATLLHAEF
jgi:tetratricopeptide (TPR) repeat protein